MLKTFLAALRAPRTRTRTSPRLHYADPGKPVACAVNERGHMQVSVADHDTGRRIILDLPPQAWRSLARAMGQHLAFRELQQRRAQEHSQKVTSRETLGWG